MTTETPIKSQYLSSEYAATDFSFPHVQVVRGEEEQSHCGYFIPLPQAQKAGWSNIEATKTIIYTYNDGKNAEGILLVQPRMVMCAVSKLGMFDRAASQDEDRLMVIGEWNREQSKDPNIGNFQIYLIMFLGESNFPLHQIPFKIIAKGAHQATLSKYWEQNCIQVAMLHAKAAKAPFLPRDERYKALCVFEPVIKRMSVGSGKTKSPACCVDGFVAPTSGNWRSFFLGEGEELLAETILQILNPQPRALQMPPSSGSVIALIPPSCNSPSTPTAPRQISAVEDDVQPTPAVVQKTATSETLAVVPKKIGVVKSTPDLDENDADFGYAEDDLPF